MPSAENSVIVNKPRSEVFDFLADPAENDMKWRPGLLDLTRASGSGLGAVYRQGVKGPMGRRIPADIEITAYEENSHIAFKTLGGPVRPEGSYRLEDADGGTRVTMALSAELRGFQKLMAPMVAKSMNVQVGALENLKRVLES